MSPTSYQAALPRVIPSLLSATLIIIPYSNGFVKRVRKVFLQQKQRMKTRLPTFFPENQQPRQFTPLREGRRFRARNAPTWSLFQFTPLREGRLILGLYLLADLIFQFTPLREGRHLQVFLVEHDSYFNSRPSARGDTSYRPEQRLYIISIHAPPRGATPIRTHVQRSGVFQFTPLREGRLDDVMNALKPILFQFTPLREGRRCASCAGG